MVVCVTDYPSEQPVAGTALDIPEGFRAVTVGGPFMAHTGPLYARWTGERLQLMASFADMLLPCASMYQGSGERRFLPTISLQVDYLGASPLGAWVQGEGDVLRTTRNMLFAQGLVTADGVPVLRVSGIFKMGALIGDGTDRDPLRLGR